MNPKEVALGMIPSTEDEKKHAYKTFRQFPELRKAMNEIDGLNFKSAEERDTLRLKRMDQKIVNRSQMKTSYHMLGTLSTSSIGEITALSDFRKILMKSSSAGKNAGKKSMRRPSGIAANNNIGESSETNLFGGDSMLLSELNKTDTIPKSQAQSQRSIMSDLTAGEDNFSTGGGSRSHDHPKDPAASADQKLAKLSLSFDAGSYINNLAAFDGQKLNKIEFGRLLRSCLNIKLRAVELDALFLKVDTDKSLLIDGVEFVRYFFALGNEARRSIRMREMEIMNNKEAAEKQKIAQEEAAYALWASEQILPFEPADMESATQKLTNTALKWDSSDPVTTQGFMAKLSPYEFKMQLERSLGLRLTGEETGAVISKFSTLEGEYCIDGVLFLKKFIGLKKRAEREFAAKRKENAKLKKRTLAMGQQSDILPPILGR